jgi:hypothetical protein
VLVRGLMDAREGASCVLGRNMFLEREVNDATFSQNALVLCTTALYSNLHTDSSRIDFRALRI